MPPRQTTEAWWKIVLRHFTTFCAIIGMLWWIATPRVEAFVHGVVNDRISRLEDSIEKILIKLNQIDMQLDRIERNNG